MAKFDIDYSKVTDSIDKKVFKYADVKHRLEKVAFDLVRFTDGNPDELWQIQDADDGSYIVAKYTEDDESKKEASTDWSVVINKTAGDVNIFYKDHPITKVAVTNVGVEKDELDTLSRFLPKRLAEDKNLARALLNYITPSEREQLLKLYPELA
jgi:hypothetical protein